jgi:glycine oxidase
MPTVRGGVNRKPYNAGMANHPDVAVVGGGIIGLTAAYFLAKAGLTVEVFDRTDLGREASWAGAGILPPGNSTRAATAIDALRAIGSERFPTFSAELRENTGIDNGYRPCGGIEFLQPGDEDVEPLWAAEGISYQRLSPSELERLEPGFGSSSGEPFLLPGMAQVRNPWHLRALIGSCNGVGVKLHHHQRVRELTTTGLLLDGGRTVTAGRYLVAAGAWSAAFVPASRVHPVRGQIVLFNPECPLLNRVVTAGKRYLVPRGDGRILVGSTEEPEAGFEKGNTADAIAELKAFALEVVPALADAAVEKCWSGLRPGTRDGLPFIGPLPGIENAFIAAGHFRAGVQLSIGTAQLLTALFTGRPPCVDPAAFRLDRDPAAVPRPAFRS